MEMDAIATEEVVVVGYGKQKKESVVSSMSTVGPAQLSVKSANLTNNIAGKLSGLIAVQRSGEPGWDDAQFFIRVSAHMPVEQTHWYWWTAYPVR